MGAGRKAAAFLLGLALLGLGAGVLALPLLLYSVWGPLTGRGRAKGLRLPGAWTAAGFALLALAAAAVAAGGRGAPLVFGGAGAAVLLRGRIAGAARISRLAPADESVLLRGALFPFRWVCLAEVKLLTRDPAAVLSNLGLPLLVVLGEKASAYAVAEVLAPTYASAEGRVLEKLRSAGAAALPAGGYLVPLDSRAAEGVLRGVGSPQRPAGAGWEADLRGPSVGSVLLRQEGGVVRSLSVCSPAPSGTAALPEARKLRRPPLVAEALGVLCPRASWAGPDGEAAVAASLASLGGQPRLAPGGEGGAAGVAIVKGFAGAETRMRRTSLRALVGLYGRRARRRAGSGST